uniref:Uncharacterized protein n=1 Tax=Timema bartmani TaxID=61472 RepID=A0A7R9I8W6_9NEOP|nr:unnamed protein product [Timema bartmani]
MSCIGPWPGLALARGLFPGQVKERFGNHINLCWDRGLSPGLPAQKSNTLLLDRQVTPGILSHGIHIKQYELCRARPLQQPLPTPAREDNEQQPVENPQTQEQQPAALIDNTDNTCQQPAALIDNTGQQPAALIDNTGTATNSTDRQHSSTASSTGGQHRSTVISTDRQHRSTVISTDRQHRSTVISTDRQHRSTAISIDRQHRSTASSTGGQHRSTIISIDRQHRSTTSSTGGQYRSTTSSTGGQYRSTTINTRIVASVEVKETVAYSCVRFRTSLPWQRAAIAAKITTAPMHFVGILFELHRLCLCSAAPGAVWQRAATPL